MPRRLQSRWEQWDLPRLSRQLGVDALYSHREAGGLWGAPLVLHIPEDPEVRWKRDPPASSRAHARRLYSRTLLRQVIRRSAVVAASTSSVANQLAARYGVARERVWILPLGVDLELFSPVTSAADFVFHLGSSDPRDRTIVVVDAWARARQADPSLPRLVIGGDLGAVDSLARRRADVLGARVELTGRLSDDDLAERFRHAAVVVQPSSDEGFGLQPLEAMAAGAPVVVTATEAVIDVVGDAAVVCGPSATELAGGILAAVASANSLRVSARARAEKYSWDASAQAVLTALAAASQSARSGQPVASPDHRVDQ
ncbi:MAG: glycosyltransferase family 4 protein [Actinobacteria bacterium]|nr:glycosyltransferase family 4 protein [Actinomycetota bacterium]